MYVRKMSKLLLSLLMLMLVYLVLAALLLPAALVVLVCYLVSLPLTMIRFLFSTLSGKSR